jgi:hypothetical protein
MKKIFVSFLLLGAATLSRATVTIDFTVGILNDVTGSTPVADGSLIQLIGSSDNVFAAPTPGAFIGGNDVLLFSGSFDSSTSGGTTGAMLFSLSNITLTPGTNLLLRWFPTLTGGSGSPGGLTPYGEYGSLTDGSWVSPANGSTVSINLLTVSAGGSTLDSFGNASLSTAAIPEPSTYAAIFGVMALGLVAYRRRLQAA